MHHLYSAPFAAVACVSVSVSVSVQAEMFIAADTHVAASLSDPPYFQMNSGVMGNIFKASLMHLLTLDESIN